MQFQTDGKLRTCHSGRLDIFDLIYVNSLNKLKMYYNLMLSTMLAKNTVNRFYLLGMKDLDEIAVSQLY